MRRRRLEVICDRCSGFELFRNGNDLHLNGWKRVKRVGKAIDLCPHCLRDESPSAAPVSVPSQEETE